MRKISKMILLGLVALLALAGVATADDFHEAMEQTEEEWQAVRNTMQQSKAKFEEFGKKYQEYEDAVFSQNPEQGIALAKKLFKLSDDQTDAAKEKLSQLREMFNTMDKNGIKDKLKFAAEKLKFADEVAGKVENVWQFTKKFDPDNAKDNPTYGLRLIGDLLKDGAGKMEKIPLVGQILGPWIKAYGEVAGDFANALDRLGKKIEDFRQGSLCGQGGYKQDQQAAFKAESKKGEDCLTYFAVGAFPRMQRGEAYEGNGSYFLFDVDNRRGYFSPLGTTDKVYRWHELLLERRALDVDWLASRSNSLKPEVETRAREYYKAFSGWRFKSDPGWLIIEKLNLTDDAAFYGRLDEETFVANYILDEKHNSKITDIWEEYDKHLILAGTVYEEQGSGTVASDGAKVELKVAGQTYSENTDSDGRYEILMEGKVNDAVDARVTKDDFAPVEQSGRLPYRVTRPQNYTLRGEAMTVVITGTVQMKKGDDDPTEPAVGATVTASGPDGESGGSTTTGGGGTYSMTIQSQKGVTVTVKATLKTVGGSTTFTVTGKSEGGVDITMSKLSLEEQDGPEWMINVTVLDGDGKNLPGATVSGSGSIGDVATGAGGTVEVGPIKVPADWEDNAFTVTFTPVVQAVDGEKIHGSSVAATYQGKSPSSVTLKLDAETAQQVTISGKVNDVNGVGLGSTTVTAGSASSATGASGSFSVGPLTMFKDSSVTVNATYSDGTNSFGGTPVTVTFDGKNTTIAGVTLVIQVESDLEVTISGRVQGQGGKPVPGVSISAAGGATATTDGAGQYTLTPMTVTLGKPVSISASITVDGTAVSGSATCTPKEATATAPTITLDLTMEEHFEVTISGTVQDDKGDGVAGATVTAGASSTTSGGGGSFSLGPIEMAKDGSKSVSATFTDGTDKFAGGPVTATFDGTNTDIGGMTITLKKDGPSLVTLSGSVIDAKGSGVSGASVSGGGASDMTGGGGSFSLGPIEYNAGETITISASASDDEGNVIGGSATIMPTSETLGGISIKLSDEFDDDDLDSLIDDLENDLDTLTNVLALKTEFDLVVLELDGLAADFDANADFFLQRLRELKEASCESSEVSYALSQAGSAKQAYTSRLNGLYGTYARLTAAATGDDATLIAGVNGDFARVADRETTIQSRYAGLLAQYGVYKCDKDKSDTDSDDEAQDDTDADDIDGQSRAEVCGDGIDNDRDGEIDECDAGCCTKNVQVVVNDCGTAADDIFSVSIDGAYVGVTPKGSTNTFNRELEPGTHTVTVTCLDDGGNPLGSDIGTACINVIIYGQDAGISGGSPQISYGSSATISFEVLEGPQSGKLNPYDGAAHRARGNESN